MSSVGGVVGVGEFREIVGARHVITDPSMTASYVSDWTGRYVGSTPAVVRPGNTAEVAAIVDTCRRLGIALVPQGGNTGLVGGAVPLAGEVVLSLVRLDGLEAVDDAAGQVTAGAGATVGSLQRAVAASGWAYPVDLASRDSATVGGTVATNAGGLRVLRYGDTRAQLLGVEAVLGTGEVISHLGGLLKDNTGYHLPSLLCGSEGTLAVVTRARLRLVRPPANRTVALLAFDDGRTAAAASAVSAGQELRSALPDLEAAELFFADGMDLVCSVLGLAPPFPGRHSAFLLVEAAAGDDPTERLAAAIAQLSAVAEVAVATDQSRRAALWRYREAHTEAISTLGPVHKLDVTLPAGSLAHFAETIAERVSGRSGGEGVAFRSCGGRQHPRQRHWRRRRRRGGRRRRSLPRGRRSGAASAPSTG